MDDDPPMRAESRPAAKGQIISGVGWFVLLVGVLYIAGWVVLVTAAGEFRDGVLKYGLLGGGLGGAVAVAGWFLVRAGRRIR